MSERPTSPEHAGHEMAFWFTLPADYRTALESQCADLPEYLRNGGTVKTLQARFRASACGTCGMTPTELQGHKFCPDC